MVDKKTYQKVLAIESSTSLCSVALKVGIDVGGSRLSKDVLISKDVSISNDVPISKEVQISKDAPISKDVPTVGVGEASRVTMNALPGEILELHTNALGKHSSAIFMHTRDLLEAAGLRFSDLDAIVLGGGPGSYTGLRVAASAVKGMLFGLDVPLFLGNTLAGFALGLEGIQRPQRIHSIIDARRKHVYHQEFEVLGGTTEISKLGEASIIEIDHVNDRFRSGDRLVGTGIERLDNNRLPDIQTHSIEETSAAGLIRLLDIGSDQLIQEVDVADFEPMYAVTESVR